MGKMKERINKNPEIPVTDFLRIEDLSYKKEVIEVHIDDFAQNPDGFGGKFLFDLFCKAQGWEPEKIRNDTDWVPDYLHPGTAYGMCTEDAVACILDTQRTSAFLKAIEQHSVEKGGLLAIEAGAGTGILALGMAVNGYQVIASEINPLTTLCAKRFITEAGYQDEVVFIGCDATRPPFKDDFGVHLLCSENNHTGLIKEPQVQIMEKWLPRLKSGGEVIPQSVELSVALAHVPSWKDKERDKEAVKFGNDLKVLSSFQPYAMVNFPEISSIGSISGKVDLKCSPDNSWVNALVLRMKVIVTERIVLEPNQASFLGTDHVIRVPGTKVTSNANLEISYQPGCQVKEMSIKLP